MDKPNTSPTIRIVNGRPVSFYSPHQLESLVPVEQRLAKSRGVSLHTLHTSNRSHARSHHGASYEWQPK